jgi:hypothetical protein
LTRQPKTVVQRVPGLALLSSRPDTVQKDLEAAKGRLTGTFLSAYTSLTRGVLIPGAQQKQISAVVTPAVRADAVAYLVNVTVRPGYNFPNADAALDYGHGICDKVSAGRGYAQVMGDVKADFNTSDEYQASYLISQAVNERCPAQIWQLRNSAAHYRPPPADG